MLKEFSEKLKTWQDLGLSCMYQSIEVQSEMDDKKIELENAKENEIKVEIDSKFDFMKKFLSEKLIEKLVTKQITSANELIFVALFFSVNRVINLCSEAAVNLYFKEMKVLMQLVNAFSENQQIKFTHILEERLCWELQEFFVHLAAKTITTTQFALFLKFLFNLEFIFEFRIFISSNVIKHVLKYISWEKISYLFEHEKEDPELIIHSSFGFWQTQNILTKKDLAQIVEWLLNIITIQLLEDKKYLKLKKSQVKVLNPTCEFINLIKKVNSFVAENICLKPSEFINIHLSDDFEFKTPTQIFLKKKIKQKWKFELSYKNNKPPDYLKAFNPLNFEFLYSTERKAEILRFESLLEQRMEQRLQGGGIFAHMFAGLSNVLSIKVNRSQLLENTLILLTRPSSTKNLKKPIRVEFRGEPGMDEGGLTKEFFSLICQELFDPKYGMFEVKNESFLWINSDSMYNNMNYELIGIIMGLAIYNKTLLDLHFPKALYKKLLLANYNEKYNNKKNIPRNLKLNLNDLKEIDPELGSTMTNTLSLDLPDDNDFGLTFEVQYKSWDVLKSHELIPNGKNIKLVNSNKRLFVEKYLDWFFNKSIEKQFKSFSQGFFKVLGNSLIYLFSADDLMMTVCGRTDLNFEELKKGTLYQDGYTADSATIKNFWKIIDEDFNQEERKKFLKFLTGNDRAPLRGLQQIKMVISRYRI